MNKLIKKNHSWWSSHFLRNVLLAIVMMTSIGVLGFVYAQMDGGGQFAPTAGSRQLAPTDVDPALFAASVGSPNNISCGRDGFSCRYANDVRFQNMRVESGRLKLEVAIRAQAEAPGTPASGGPASSTTVVAGNVDVLNFGNVLGAIEVAIYHDTRIFPQAYLGTASCSLEAASLPSERFDPFNSPMSMYATPDHPQFRVTLEARYEDSGPNADDESITTNYFVLTTDTFKTMYTLDCAVPQGIDTGTSFAGIRFDTRVYNTFQQLVGANRVTFRQAIRYVNDREFFPLDGVSAFIETAYLADTNRHVAIKFNRDLPDDAVVTAPSSYRAIRGYYNDNGVRDSSSTSIEYTAVEVIQLSSRDVWVVFPESLATDLNNKLLENVLITATFAGQNDYIAAGYDNQASYRVAVVYGHQRSSGDATMDDLRISGSLPPRIASASFEGSDTVRIRFTHPVSSHIQADEALVPGDFSVTNWNPTGRDIVTEIVSVTTVAGSNDQEFLLTLTHSGADAGNLDGNYIHIRSSDRVESEFYITTSNIFRKDMRVTRDMPALSSSYAQTAGVGVDSTDGDYGVGMRDNPGNTLLAFSTASVLTMPVLSSTVDETTLTFSWPEIENAAGYAVNLYSGTDRTVAAIRSGRDVETSGGRVSTTISSLRPVETYTVEVTALAAAGSNFINSEAGVLEAQTGKLTLPSPTRSEIMRSATTNTLTVKAVGVPSVYSDLYPEGVVANFNYLLSLERQGVLIPGTDSTLTWSGAMVSYTYEGLTPNTEYKLVVIANSPINDLFNDSERRVFNIRTEQEQLPVPSGISVVVGVTTVTLNWVAGSAGEAAEYVIFVDGGNAAHIPVSDENYTLRGLIAGRAYTLRVIARAEGYIMSDPYIEVLTTKVMLSMPVLSSTVDETTLTFSWPEIANAAGYQVNLYLGTDTTAAAIRSGRDVETSGGRVSTTISSLRPLETYTVEVRALAAAGSNFVDSEAGVLTAETEKLTLPVPTEMEVMASATTDTITVSWTDTLDNVARYELSLALGSAPDTEVASAMVDATMPDDYTFTGLMLNTAYIVSVVSSNDETLYNASPALMLPVTTEDLPQLSTPEVTLMQDSESGFAFTVVTWDTMVDALTYEFTLLNSDGSPALEGSTPVDVSEGRLRFRTQASNRTFILRVVATGPGFRDSPAQDFRFTTNRFRVPTPRIIQVDAEDDTAVVRWDTEFINFFNNDIGSGVRLSFYLDNEDSPRASDVSGKDGMYQLTGLMRSTAYILGIVALHRESIYIESRRATTQFATAGSQLEAPQLLVPQVDETAVTFSWLSVNDATTYLVSVYLGTEASGEPLATEETGEERYEFNGDPVQSYTVAVAARADDFLDSAPATTTVMTRKVTLGSPTTEQVSVTATTDVITLSWTGAPADVARYELSLSLDSAPDTEVASAVVAVMGSGDYAFTGLMPNTAYIVSVASSNDETLYNANPALVLPVATEDLSQLSTPEVSLMQDSEVGFTVTIATWDTMDLDALTYEFTLLHSDGSPVLAGSTPVDVSEGRLTFRTQLYHRTLMSNLALRLSVVATGPGFRDSPAQDIPFRTSALRVQTPRLVRIDNIGTDAATVHWDNSNFVNILQADGISDHPSYVGSIRLRFFINDEAAPHVEDVEAMAGMYHLTGLMPGTDYTLGVVAYHTDTAIRRDSRRTTMQFTTLEQLEVPQLAEPQVNEAMITFSWSMVPDATTYAVSVYLGTDTTINPVAEDLVSGLSYTYTGAPVQQYTIAVIARGGVGFSDSVAATTTVMTGKVTLSSPTAEQVSAVATTDAITVSWTGAPANVARYELSLSLDSAPDTEVASAVVAVMGSGDYAFTGLMPNMAYIVSVVSSNDETLYNASAALPLSVTTENLQQLATPEGFSVEDVTEYTATINWQPVPSAEEYQVFLREDGDPSESDYEVDMASSEATGLEPDTRYIVEVVARAKGRFLDSERGSVEFSTLQVQLAMPEGLDAMVSERVVTWSWSSVSDATSYAVSVYQGADTLSVLLLADVIDVTSYSYTGDPVQEYTIEVVARADGFRNSDAATFTAMTGKVTLGSPTAEQVSAAATTDTITVSWTGAPADVARYELSLSLDSAPDTAIDSAVVEVMDSMSHAFTGLMPGTAYSVSVVSSGDEALYNRSTTLVLSVTTEILQLMTPENLAVQVSEAVLTFSWSPVPDATTYAVSVYLGTDTTAQPVVEDLVQMTSYTYTGGPVQQYTIEVIARAARAAGFRDSAPATTTAMTERVTLGRPTSEQVSITAFTAEMITVSWTGAPENVERYELRLSRTNDVYNILESTVVETMDPGDYVFTADVIPLNRYIIWVIPRGDETLYRTTNSSSLFLYVSTPHRRQKLDTPTGFVISSLTADRVVIEWDPVLARSYPSGPIEEYQVFLKEEGSNNYVGAGDREGFTVTTPLSEITGFMLDTPYIFEVMAKSADMDTLHLDSDRGRFRFTVNSQLDTPTGFVISSLASERVVIDWDAVLGTEEYQVFLREEGSGDYIGDGGSAGSLVTVPSSEITGFMLDTPYVLEVIAKGTGFQDSERSTYSFTVNLQLPVPTGLAVISTDVAGNGVVVGWDAVLGAEEYFVVVREENSGDVILDNFETVPSRELVNLTDNTSYVLEVVAKGAGFRDSDPGIFNFTFDPQLDRPTGFVIRSFTADGAVIGWDAVPGAEEYLVFLWEQLAPPPGEGFLVTTPSLDTRDYERFDTLFVFEVDTSFTLRVVARGTGFRDSEQFGFRFTINSKLVTPRRFVISSITTDRVVIEWDAVLGADEYQVFLREEVSNNYVGPGGSAGAPAMATSREITNFMLDTPYVFEVVAKGTRPFRNSERSAFRFTVNSQLATPQLSVRLFEDPLTMIVDELEASWPHVPGAERYRIRHYQGFGTETTPIGTRPLVLPEGRERIFHNVPRLTAHGVHQRTQTWAFTAEGGGLMPSEPALIYFLGSPNEGQFMVDATTDAITVSWMGEPPDGVQRYDLSLLQAGQPVDFVRVEASTNSHTFTGLMPATAYRVSVGSSRDETSVATSAFVLADSPRVLRITTDELPQLPAPAFTLSAGDTTVLVDWNAATAGDAITYVLSLSNEAGDTTMESVLVSAGGFEFTGLVPETAYTVRAIAQGDPVRFRDSESAEESITTTTLGPQQLATPENLDVQVSETILTFSWSAVSNAENYLVSIYLGDDTTGELATTAEVTMDPNPMYAFTGEPVQEYTIEVIARAAGFRDSDAATTTVMTGKETLGSPTAEQVSAVATTDVITVSWTGAPANVARYELSLALASDPGTAIDSAMVDATMPDNHAFTGLTPNTAYIVSVVSRGDEALYNASAVLALPVATEDLPQLSTPEVTLMQDSESGFAFTIATWDAMGLDALTYEFTLLHSGEVVAGSTEVDVSAERFMFITVTNTSYTLRVVAKGAGFSDSAAQEAGFKSAIVRVQTPQLVRVDSIGSDAATVHWDSSNFVNVSREDFPNNAGNVRLRFFIDDETGARAEGVEATAQMHRLTGLMPATGYTLSAVAYNRPGTASRRDSRRATTEFTTLELKLETPQLAMPQVNEAMVTFSWTMVPDATTYAASVYRGTDTTSTPVAEDLINELSYTYTGDPAQQYTIEVIARSLGFRDSDAATATVMTGRVTLPAPAFGLSASTSTILVDWDAANAGDATTYRLTLSNMAGETTIESVAVSEEEFEFTGLAFETTYTVSVVAQGDPVRFLDSGPVAQSRATLPEGTGVALPEQPVFAAVLGEPADRVIEVSWTAPPAAADGAPITGYTVLWRIAGSAEDDMMVALAGDVTMYQITSLTAETNYEVAVLSRNIAGLSVETRARATVMTLQPKLATPGNLDIQVSEATLTISWSAVSNAESYLVSVYLGDDTTGELATTAGVTMDTNPTYAFMGAPVQEYTIEVIARAAGYRDSDAAMMTEMTERVTLATPTTEQVSVTATTDVITVSWTGAPANVSSYDLSLALDSDPDTEIDSAMVEAMDSRAHAFTDLMPKTAYRVSVVSSGNEALYNASSALVLSVSTKDLPQLTTPQVSVNADDIGDTYALLSWTADDAATTYRITLTDDDAGTVADPVPVAANTGRYMLENLTPDTNYTVTVIAEAAGFRDSEPQAESFTTLEPQLMPPDDLNAMVSETILTFSWVEAGDTVDYLVSLYLGTDVSGELLGSEEKVDREGGRVSTTISGLDPVQSYTVVVVARAAGFRDSAPATTTAMTGKETLDSPTTEQVSVAATPATTDTITVSWTGAPDNVVRYELSLSLDSDPGTEIDSVIADATAPDDYTFTGLTPSTVYIVSVVSSADETLYNASPALALSVTTKDLPQLPAPAVALMHDSEETFAFTVATWDAMDLDALTYEFTLLNSQGNQVLAGSTPVDVSIERLRFITGTYTTFVLRVVAKGAGFRDSMAQEVSFDSMPARVQMPRLTRVDAIGLDTATVHWDSSHFVDVNRADLPNNAGDSRLRFFINDEVAPRMEGVQATAQMYRLTGLMPATDYTLGVVAYNVNTDRKRRDSRRTTIQFTTLEQLETPQLAVPQVNETMVTFSWSEVPDATTYAVSVYFGADTTINPVAEDSIDGLSYTYTGDPVQQYTIEVIARGGAGFADSAAATTTVMTGRVTLPSPAFTLSAGDTRILVDWNAANAGDATTYSLTLSNMAGGTTLESVSVSDGSFTFRRLAFETTFTVSVVAQGDPSIFLDSEPVARSIVTLAQGEMAALPEQPVFAAMVVEPADRVIEVSWTAVPDAERAPILGYTVLWRIAGSAEDDMMAALAGDVLMYQITGLTAETSYEVTVLSRNITGLSIETSDRALVRTLQPKLATPEASVNEDDIGETSVLVTWVAGDAAITYTIILRDDKGAAVSTTDVTADRAMLLLENLTPDTNYTATVVATAAGFRASDPQVLSFTTLEPQLPTPAVALMHDSEAGFTFTIATWDAMDLDALTYEFTLLNHNGSQVLAGSTEVDVSAERFMFITQNENASFILRVVARGMGFRDSAAQEVRFQSATLRVQTPRLTRVDDIGVNAVTVHWDSSNFVDVETSSFPNNAHRVRLRFFINDETNPRVEGVQATAQMYRLTGLMPGTDYTLSVVAYSGSLFITGRDSRRATTQFTTLEPKLETPQLAVPQVDETTLKFVWPEIENADEYEVALYSGTDRTAEAIRRERHTEMEEGRITTTIEGLRPVETYTVEVIALANGFRDSDAATTTVMTEKETLGSPTAEQLSAAATTDMITVNWTGAPDNVARYELSLSLESTPNEVVNSAVVAVMDSMAYAFTGLMPNTAYLVSVVSSNDETLYNASAALALSVTTDNLPQLPAPAFTLSASTSTILVDWNAANAGDATTYSLALSNESGDTTMESVSVSAGDFAFTGLAFETTYTVSVVAQGDPVNFRDSEPVEQSVTTLAEGEVVALPEQPDFDAMVVEPADSVIEVSWTAPAAVEGAPILGYTVLWRIAGSAENDMMVALAGDVLMYQITGLTADTSYEVAVLSRNIAGLSEEAMERVTVMTLQPQLAVPENLNVQVSEATLMISWSAVSNAESYLVSIYLGDDTTGELATTAEVTMNTNPMYEFVGEPVQEYTVAVVARATSYRDSASAMFTAMTGKETLGSPTPEQVSVDATTDVITVSWTGVPANVTSYDLSLSQDSAPDTEIDSALVDATMPDGYTFTGLTPNTAYIVSVVSSGDEALYNASAALVLPVSTEDLPQLTTPQVSVNEGDIGETSALVTWVADDATITYTIILRDDTGAAVSTTDVTADRAMLPLANLTPDTRYTVTVIAEADGFRDSEPQALNFMTLESQLVTPENLDVMVSEVTLMISWSAVDNAENYLVSIYLGDDTTGELATTAEVTMDTNPMHEFVGEPVQEYTVVVVARAAGFRDSAPATTTAMTGKETLDSPTAEHVSVDTTTDVITVSWTGAPDNVARYELSLSLLSALSEPVDSAVVEVMDSGFYAFTGLMPNTAYIVSVVSSNDETLYNASAALTLLVGTEDLPQLTTPQVSVNAGDIGETSALVTWVADEATITYRITLTDNDAGTVAAPVPVTADMGSYMLANLRAGTRYTVTVIATADGFRDSERGRFEFSTLQVQLAMPENLDVMVSEATLMISWSEVDNAENYLVSIYLGGDTTGELATTAEVTMDTNPMYAFLGEPVQEYTIEVAARADGFRDSAAATTTAMTGKETLGSPTAEHVSVAATTDVITVSWTGAPDNVARYELSLSLGSASDTEVDSAVVEVMDSDNYVFTGLMPNTAYIVSVVSSNDGTLYNASAALELSVTTDKLPQLPAPAFTFSASTTTVLVDWDAAAAGDATTYRLTLSNMMGDTTMESVSVSEGDFEFPDLAFETTYTVSVIAQGDPVRFRDSESVERSVMTLAEGATIKRPEQPVFSAMVGEPADTVIKVSWTAPSAVEGAPIIGYTVLWRIAGSTDDEMMARLAGDVLMYRITGLTAETSYEVTVLSRNIAGLSEETMKRVTVMTLQPKLTTPEVLVNEDDIGDTYALLSWTAGEAASTYRITLTDEDASTVVDTATVAADRGSHMLANLTPDTRYTVTVVAVADGFRDSDTQALNFMTLEPQLVTPENLDVQVSEATLMISWSEVNNAESYVVSVYLGADTTGELATTAEVTMDTNPMYAFLGEPVQEYTVAVAARAAGFRDSAAATTTAMTGKETLGSPTTEQVSVAATTDAITVSWTGAPDNVARYELSLSLASASDTEVDSAVAEVMDSDNYVFTGLMPNTAYIVSVVSSNDGTLYNASAALELSVTTDKLPQLPAPAFTLSASTTTVLVDWDAAAAGDAITYSLTLSNMAGDTTMESVSVSEGDFEFLDLAFETTYTVSVIAQGDPVRFRDSEPVERSVMTLAEGATIERPKQPVFSAMVGEPADTVIKVSWTAVPDADGAPIIGYTVLWRIAGSADDDMMVTLAGNVTMHQITDLTAETSYEVAVLSRNIAGLSEETMERVTVMTLPPGLRLRLRVFLEGPLQ